MIFLHLDLHAARSRLEAEAPALPAGVRWAGGREVVRLRYPIDDCPAPRRALRLDDGPHAGNLLGMKGQYLVLSSGALNVRQHAGYRVRVTLYDEALEDPGDAGTQAELF